LITSFPDFALESTGQLAGAWTPVPEVTGFSVVLPVTAQNQYFRLKCKPQTRVIKANLC
jgi:hypothetical protein